MDTLLQWYPIRPASTKDSHERIDVLGRSGGVGKKSAPNPKAQLNTTNPSLNTALRVLPFLAQVLIPAAHQNPMENPAGHIPITEVLSQGLKAVAQTGCDPGIPLSFPASCWEATSSVISQNPLALVCKSLSFTLLPSSPQSNVVHSTLARVFILR